MEHHFLPASPTPFDIKVPYVGPPPKEDEYAPYDNGTFLDYPKRLRMPWLLPSRRDTLGRDGMFLERRLRWTSTKQQQEILQSWLFFGLLSVFMRSVYCANDYITETESGVFINTAQLTAKMAEAWRSNAADATPKQQRAQFSNAVRCLRASADVLQGCREDFDWRIRLSITSVMELFGQALNRAYSTARAQEDIPAPSMYFPKFPPSEQVHDSMRTAGWCPYEIATLATRFTSLQTMVFLSRLDKSQSSRSHANCTNSQCIAYQIDLETYKTAHTTSGCTCPPLTVDDKAIRDILRTDALPVLQIRNLTRAEPIIRVVPSSQDTPFVALSHVWADGLGNPDANELPTCQVLELGRLAIELIRQAALSNEAATVPGDIVNIWIDTICCPTAPVDVHMLSIQRMRETYTSASYVLVLENSLRAKTSQSIHAVETLLSIFTSAWFHRLWTLQEGFLPKSLWVQFSDGLLNLDRVYEHLIATFFNDIRVMSMSVDIGNCWRGLRRLHYRALTDPDRSVGTRLFRLDQALIYRSVSHADDEPLCISTLLNISPDFVAKENGLDRRMAALWQTLANEPSSEPNTSAEQSTNTARTTPSPVEQAAARLAGAGLPQKMILLDYPRIREPGFRWAPRTLLQAGPSSRLMPWLDPELGRVTPQGFIVRYRALRVRLELRTGLPPAAEAAAARAARADLRTGFSFILPGTAQRCTAFLNEGMIFARSSYEHFPALADLAGKELAMLLAQDVPHGKAGGTGSTAAAAPDSCIAVLVQGSGETTEHGIPVVQMLCPVVLKCRDENFAAVNDARDEAVRRILQGGGGDGGRAVPQGPAAPQAVPPAALPTLLSALSTAEPERQEPAPDANVATVPARAVIRERPALRAALQALSNSTHEDNLVRFLEAAVACALRFEARGSLGDRVEEWCIS